MLTACSSNPPVEVRVEKIDVPESLIPECPDVVFTGRTVGDVLQYNQTLLEHYQNCQDDVDALREWLTEE